MDWHLPAFASVHDIAYALVNNLVDGEASPNMGSLFSILSVDPIIKLKTSSRADNAGMLSKGGHVE